MASTLSDSVLFPKETIFRKKKNKKQQDPIFHVKIKKAKDYYNSQDFTP